MVTRTEPLVYTSDWEIPSKGIFECDYVSPIRPPDDAEPAEGICSMNSSATVWT